MRARLSEEDIDRSAQHSEEHKGRTGKFGDYFTEDVQFWKVPERRDNRVAIIPYFCDCKENSVFRSKNPELNLPFTEEQLKKGNTYDYKLNILTHSNIGANQDTVVCPGTIREHCPVCELRKELLEERDEDDEDVRSLYQRRTTLYNIVVMTTAEDIDKGLMVWAAPTPSIEEALVNKRKDRTTGELRSFAYPKAGWDVIFDKVGQRIKTKYENLDLIKRRKEDEFSEEDIETLIDQAFDFEKVVEILPYDTLKEMLGGTGQSAARERSGGERFGQSESKEERRTEDLSERSSRFRGKDSESDTAKSNLRGRGKREEKKEDSKPDCFGLRNQELHECDDCDVWGSCYKTQEDKKVVEEKEGGRLREATERGRGRKKEEEEPKTARGSARQSRFARKEEE
jgi:hypothetical protein